MTVETQYSVGELAELGGVSRRTVRYYVRRGLLDPPLGSGRGSYYTEDHLDRLRRIKRAQEVGVPLAEIQAALGGAPAEAPTPRPLPESTRWRRIVVADGVELHVRDAQLEPGLVRRMGEALAEILREDQ